MDGRFVAYDRVSTEKQDVDCAAQRLAVETWLNGGHHELIGQFTEVENGKNNGRPRLDEALALCRRRKASLVIAKLDRLSGNLAFIANLSGVWK
jgi:DNA invertase Pin-like site-specific DNA recombinase